MPAGGDPPPGEAAASEASPIEPESNGSSSTPFASARSAGARLGAPTALERSRAASELDRVLKETPADQVDALCASLASDSLEEMRVADGDSGSQWHRRLGGATLLQTVASFSVASSDEERLRSRRCRLPWETEGESSLLAALVSAACSLLRGDPEPRVRLAAAGALGALASATSGDGGRRPSDDEGKREQLLPPVWVLGARDAIFDVCERDWDRDSDGKGSMDGGPVATAEDGGAPGDGLPLEALSVSSPSSPSSSSLVDAALSAAYRKQLPGKGELRHGTEGWRGLETAFAALLAVADGAGAAFAPVVRSCPSPSSPPTRDCDVRSLVLRSLLHPNRFVRESGYGALGGICALAGRVGELDRWEGVTGEKSSSLPSSSKKTFADAAADALADGLSENWSQVRLAACVAARSLLAAAAADDAVNGRASEGEIPPSTTTRQETLHARLLARLLPPLAFNRYDSAEGVRAYSNETWLLHTRGRGRAWVAGRASEVFAYYLRCSRANNHMVREAAAVCVGELFAKIGSGSDETTSTSSTSSPADAVRPLVPRALALLLSAARDDAWPVRDEGGRALAGLLAAFPVEVLSSTATSSSSPPSPLPTLDALVAVWRDNLEDNVPSVRDGGAASMVAALEGLLRKKEEKRNEDGDNDDVDGSSSSLVSLAASRLSSAIESTIEERLPEAKRQPPGECAGAPSAAPLRTQQAPTAAPGGKGGLRPLQAPSPSAPGATPAPGDDDSQLFSASDLLRRSRRVDTGGVDFSCGCMDYGLRRPVEPWERSDGAARLLREYSRVAAAGPLDADEARGGAAVVARLAGALADACRLRHYSAAPALRETAFSALPVLAKSVGIRAFKASGALEPFLGPLFDCLESSPGGGVGRGGAGAAEGDSPRSVAAAGAALAYLRDAMGPRIFSGRLEDDRQRELMRRAEEDGVVPPPSGAYAGVGGGSGGGGLLRGSVGVGALFGRPPTTTKEAAPPRGAASIPLPPLGTEARPEGYCPGGMPLRK